MRTRAVEVGGVKVDVTPIRWGHWSQLKEQFAAALGSRLVPEVLGWLGRVESGEADKDTMTWLAGRIENLSGSLGDMLADAVRSVDGLMLTLISGCTTDVDHDLLTAAEVLALAEAAIEASDLPGLLAREKNFFTAVVTAATAGRKTEGKTEKKNPLPSSGKT